MFSNKTGIYRHLLTIFVAVIIIFILRVDSAYAYQCYVGGPCGCCPDSFCYCDKTYPCDYGAGNPCTSARYCIKSGTPAYTVNCGTIQVVGGTLGDTGWIYGTKCPTYYACTGACGSCYPVCVPRTCSYYSTCGTHSDGCGGTICCPCTCSDYGSNLCGYYSNGCGSSICCTGGCSRTDCSTCKNGNWDTWQEQPTLCSRIGVCGSDPYPSTSANSMYVAGTRSQITGEDAFTQHNCYVSGGNACNSGPEDTNPAIYGTDAVDGCYYTWHTYGQPCHESGVIDDITCTNPDYGSTDKQYEIPSSVTATCSHWIVSPPPTGTSCFAYCRQCNLDYVYGYYFWHSFGSRDVDVCTDKTYLIPGTESSRVPPLASDNCPYYTINGALFFDENKNGERDGEDSCYSGTVNVTCCGQSKTVNLSCSSPSDESLTQFCNQCVRPTIEITLQPPSDYSATGWYGTSNNGTGSVDASGTGATASFPATATALGTIEVNFGINNWNPWIQTDNDIRPPAYPPSNLVPDPATQSCGTVPTYASVAGSGESHGIIYVGSSDYAFCTEEDGCQERASVNRWVVGGTTYPETYGLSGLGGSLNTSYNYIYSRINELGIPKEEISILAPGLESGYAYIIDGNTELVSDLTNAIYIINGDLDTPTGTYTFSGDRNYIFLISGDLNINGNVKVNPGSTATFITKQDIIVASDVGNTDITSLDSNIEGLYSADGSFVIEGLNNCPTETDKRLNLAGSIVVNAGLSGGTFQNNRNLCEGGVNCPVLYLSERLDFVLNAPEVIKYNNYIWKEESP